MKTEPPSATGGNGTSGGNNGGNTSLRSASPHRNAYEAGLAALKKATDHLNNPGRGIDRGSKPALLPRPTDRGRKYGSNVHRIKNMFMQMQSPGDEEDGKTIGKSLLFVPTNANYRNNQSPCCFPSQLSNRAARSPARFCIDAPQFDFEANSKCPSHRIP